jgi:hypothetical protein
MPISIQSIDELQTYLKGVLGRADHHADNVEGIALSLMGAVIWVSSGKIEVRTYGNQTANQLWFEVNKKRYALTYNHSILSIELRKDTSKGDVIANFNNSTSHSDIIQTFKGLS